jgi:hypothetical protein
MSACSQIVERHRVFSQIKGVAQRARTPLSGKLMPNLLHLGYRPMAVRKTATALRKDTVSLRSRRRRTRLTFRRGLASEDLSNYNSA